MWAGPAVAAHQLSLGWTAMDTTDGGIFPRAGIVREG